ncbi:MAG: hypothetical protein JWN41_1505 [Thermoleophilia bacterium]|nr:hypothetical protein [Thermoleophilia bacterium]
MRIGSALVLLAIGAILTFAVNVSNSTVAGVAVDWDTVGVILMIVGAVGLIWALMTLNAWRDRRAVGTTDTYAERPAVDRTTTYVER